MRQNSHRSFHGLAMRMLFCLLALSGTSTVLVAQQNPDTQAPSTPSTPSTQSQDIKPVVLVMPTYSQNIALLGTDQRYLALETLEARRRTFFVYGMGFSETYNNAEGNSAVQDSSEFLWSPHAAIISASNHSSFSVQYSPSLSTSTSGPSNHQVYQSGTVSFGQPISRSWVLQFGSANTYGTDAARLVSPLAFNVNQGVPVVDPNSAVYQLNRGDVLTTSNNVALAWEKSASETMSFSGGESTFIPIDGGQNTTATSTFGNVSYSRAVSQHTSFSVGGNYYHQFAKGSCDSYGFSVGVSHQLGRYLNLSLAGGPEFETAPCNKTLGGNYAASLSYPLSRRSRVGLSAGRSYATNYLSNTQWTDTGVVSYGRQLSEVLDVNFNSGYARSVRTPATLETYLGYFVGADVSWKVSRTIAIVGEYRRFGQVSGGPTQSQNVGLLTLGWNPLPTRIVK